MAGSKSSPRPKAPVKITTAGKAADFPLQGSVGYHVRITHRRITQHLALLIGAEQISLGMWYFLRALWEEDGLTQRELAERIGLEAPAAVEQLRNMEQRGLIERRRSAEDRRKMHVFLTAEGQALKAVLLPYARQVVDSALAGFSRREVAVLLRMLARMQNNLAGSRPGPDAAKP